MVVRRLAQGRIPMRDRLTVTVRAWGRLKIFGIAALICLAPRFCGVTFAAKTIYRCEANGQVMLTDKPCDGAQSPENASTSRPTVSGASTISSSSNPSAVGDWRGQIQYQGRENEQTLEEAHSVVPLALSFTADGKVSGASAENGCHWLGIWAQSGRIINMDVSLTGCHYAGLNRRYAGTYLLAIPDSSGAMLLQAFTMPFSGQGARLYDVKGTLRR